MGGAAQPTQQLFNPIPPQLQPLLMQLAGIIGGPRGIGGGPTPGVPVQGAPAAGQIFQQLYGGGGGAGSAPNRPRPQAPPQTGAVPSGSRMIRSGAGGPVPTFGQEFLRKRGY